MLKPYISTWYNPKKRKPLLRLRILETLAMRGELSKSKTERYFQEQREILDEKTRPHYKEISDAFDKLSHENLVERCNTILAVKEKPYSLTDKGLDALINEPHSLSECWAFIIGYCNHTKEQTKFKFFPDILNVIMRRFLPYPSLGDYSHILEIFLRMSERLTNELIDEDNFVQELLLVLGESRSMTLSEIASKTGKNYSVISKTIEELSMDCSDYTDIYDLTNDIDRENQRLRFMDFLQHCIIITYKSDGGMKYELSLYGILVLLKTVMNEKNYRSISFEKKLNHIALLYKDKLPLIFDKWLSLRRSIKLWSFYNFDTLLTDTRPKLSVPVITGGNKEIFDSLYSMYVLNNITCEKVLKMGIEMLEEFEKKSSEFSAEFEMKKKEVQGTILNDSFKKYLNFRYMFLNIETSIDDIFRELKRSPDDNGDNELSSGVGKVELIKILEKVLADEVTLVYYINLTNPYCDPFPLGNLFRSIMQEVTESIEEGPKNITNPLSARDNLRLLIKRDDDIRSFLSRFRNDSLTFDEELAKHKRRLYDSLFDAANDMIAKSSTLS